MSSNEQLPSKPSEEDPASITNNNSTSSDSVRVAVRVRPLNAREKANSVESKVSWDINSLCITQYVDERPIASNSFAFDNIFQEDSTNTQIFSTVAKPVVKGAVEGVNTVIFAYGQTAAGKTYTMLGTEDDPGVTKRSITAVFEEVGASKGRQYLLRASYIEIYNEIIRDLLSPGNDNLKIHEDVISKRVFVDCREEVVTSVQDVMSIIAAGEHARAVGETNMNDRSSRSHTIFSLKIESREVNSSDPEQDDLNTKDNGIAVRMSTLSLVDLAGSERASFTKAQGMRLVEGGHINKSLLTLGTVINKLSSGEKAVHIPYRDSKLTRILQPALGGNARTAIICAVTPAILHMDETLSTLKFASRAKKVTNHASANEYLDDRAKLRRSEKEVERLKKELQRVSAQVANPPAPSTNSSPKRKESPVSIAERMSRFEKKFKVLVQALDEHSALEMSEGITARSEKLSLEECRLRYALDLARIPKIKSVSTGSSEVEADLRKKLMEIEKEKHRLRSEIEYERSAMNAEVGALLASNEAAERSRMAAERECDEAMAELAQAQAASLVDEIISQSVTASYVSKELRKARETFDEMEIVKQRNEAITKQSAEISKQNAEMVKREKRGVGPVLKEVSLLKTKLADCENKLRSTRQSSSKLTTEKIALERDLKDKDRKMKVLTGEIDRHRNHVALGQARVAKEAAEEKKKFEAALGKADEQAKRMESELAKVKDDLQSNESKVAELTEELSNLTAEKEKIEENRKTVTTDLQEARAVLEKTQQERDELSQSLQEAKEAESCTRAELEKFSEELSEANLKLEETGSELSDAMKERDEREKKYAREMEAVHKELEQELGNHELAKNHLEQTRTELEKIAEQHEETQTKLKQAVLETNELSKALQETKDREASTVEELDKISEELSQALLRIDETMSELSEATKGREKLEKNHETEMQSVRKDMEQKIANEAQERAHLKESLKKKQESVEALERDMSRQLEGMQAVEERVEEANTAKSQALATCDELRKKCCTLEEAIIELKNTAIETVTCGYQESIELRSELAAVSEKYEKLVVTHGSTVHDLEAKYTSVSEKNEMLMKQLHKALSDSKRAEEILVRLAETVQEKDKRMYALEDKLVEYSRGEGAIARLNGRVQRRDTVITRLSQRIDVLEELIEKGELSSDFYEVTRICNIEETNEMLRNAKQRVEDENDRLENEKVELIEESRKLRELLKMKDVQRFKDSVKQKEKLQQVLTSQSEDVPSSS